MTNKAQKYEPRTCIYRIPAAAAREMYKSRSPHDKGTPFKQYIVEVARQSGLKFPIADVELY